MSEAYRIKKYHHVTEAKHRRLREEKLAPLLDMLAAYNLLQEDVDDLLSTSEVMELHMDGIDRLEECIGIIQNMLEGDWLVERNDDEGVVHVMKFKRYTRHPHKHLYVKHFAELSHVFDIPQSEIPEELHETIVASRHLETLPLELSRFFDNIEPKVVAEERQHEKAQQKEHDLKAKKVKPLRTYGNLFPALLIKVRYAVMKQKGIAYKTASISYTQKLDERIRRAFKPGMTLAEIVVATLSGGSVNTPNPNKEIDKQAWAIFKQLYPGQVPKKGEIAEIRQEIIRNQTNQ